jgi:hypothetical protein
LNQYLKPSSYSSSKLYSREKVMQKQPTLPFLRQLRIILIALGVALLLIAWVLLVRPANASPASIPLDSPQNEACLTCHNKPDFQRPMPSGETLSLTIDRTHFRDSVHSSISCTDCHTSISSFPHPTLTAQTLRDVSLQFYTICQTCHAEQYDQTLDSVHQKALAAGNNNAAICTDCHNPHTQTPILDPVPQRNL